jgi:hypothetical protein
MAHILLRIWLILWVITLPLVHIHPEADHAHGMPGHVHGGTYHTALSSTPICAYENHQHHHDSFSPEEAFPSPDSPIHPPHGLEHDTLTFSVLNSSIDPIFEESVSFPTSDIAVACEMETPSLSFVFAIDASPPATPFSILTNSLSPRAPPILSV